MINAIPIKEFEAKGTHHFFFDANVWLLLFCPLGDYSKSKQTSYSNFLQQAVAVGSSISINSLIISEFCNRYLRIDFNLLKLEFTTIEFKKDYINSSSYKSTVSEIIGSLDNILKIASRIPDEFNSIDLPRLYKSFENIDFNDSYYSELCERKNWILVSDDGDFAKIDSNITLVTANTSYF